MKKMVFLIVALAWGILTWHLTTTPNLAVAPENWLNTLIMNGGHFTFFGVQAALLYLTHPSLILSLSLTSMYGLLIELVQRNIPGRSADPIDFLLDTLGAIIFLVILKRLKVKH